MQNSILIIGAGPAGLTTAKELKAKNILFDHIEKHSDVNDKRLTSYCLRKGLAEKLEINR